MPLAAQSAFEVASLKVETIPQPGRLDVAPGGRVVARNVSLPALIMFGYEIRGYRIVGIPDWGIRERYSIEAKAENRDATVEQLREMMRALLSERFKLQVHRETRDLDGFELSRVNASQLGPQIQVSRVKCSVEERIKGQSTSGSLCGVAFTAGNLKAGAITMAELCEWLDTQVGGILVDRTGAGGEYDLTLMWTPDLSASDTPSIFTALREQLGLKVERKKIPTEVLVYDSAERPTEN
jgi:uncharacterized protein (TIGR03435 family)